MQNNTFPIITPPRLAVLIDAENISATHAAHLMELVTQRGNPTIRRAYADWTNQHLASWRKVLEKLVIRPVQQFHYSKGKNTTDSALIMDAMELLHERDRRVDASCRLTATSRGWLGASAKPASRSTASVETTPPPASWRLAMGLRF